MKKIILLLAAISFYNFAQATTISAPSSLTGKNALDGTDAYEWGLSINTGGLLINSATITFSDVTLTVANSSGKGYLYTDLLKLNTSGVKTVSDNDKSGDYFSSALPSSSVTQLGTEKFKSVGTTLSWSYTLNTSELAALNAYLAAGTLTIGFDPDCHYTVGGITFTYTTVTPHTVPDYGTSLLLLGLALMSVELFRRNFAFAK